MISKLDNTKIKPHTKHAQRTHQQLQLTKVNALQTNRRIYDLINGVVIWQLLSNGWLLHNSKCQYWHVIIYM